MHLEHFQPVCRVSPCDMTSLDMTSLNVSQFRMVCHDMSREMGTLFKL